MSSGEVNSMDMKSWDYGVILQIPFKSPVTKDILHRSEEICGIVRKFRKFSCEPSLRIISFRINVWERLRDARVEESRGYGRTVSNWKFARVLRIVDTFSR